MALIAALTPITDAFSASYAEARDKFHAAAAAGSLAVERHTHPNARGARGEPLSIDVGLLGDQGASALLVLTSGMHGVEGFAGSGCQIALLRDGLIAASAHRSGVALLFVHSVNPHGFSHLRRTNEDNVDVNRNFRDFREPPVPNADYASVHAMLVPDEWPPSAENAAEIGAYLARHGATRLQRVVSGGQGEFAVGLFYAGQQPVWSNLTLREILRRHGASRRRVGWIDLHSGLGPWGHGERILNGPDDAATIARARAWFGSDVTTIYDGTSASALVSGASFHAALESCPHAEYTGVTLEFGTRPLHEILQALRADQWLANHPDAAKPMRVAIKRQIRDAFHDDGDAWQSMIYGQARVAVLQALAGLSHSG